MSNVKKTTLKDRIRAAVRAFQGKPKDPTSQIIALAEEIKQYREKIETMDKYIKEHVGPEPVTVRGYEAESLRLVAELLRKHMITPDDLRDLTNNFTRAAQIVYTEKADITAKLMEEALKNFLTEKEAPPNE